MKLSVYTLGGLAVAAATYAHAVPAEFAALEQPHMEVMDLAFLGKSLGTVQVRLTPDTIEFLQPAQIVSRLQVIEARRAEVLAWLSKPLPRNDALSCQAARSSDDCGRMSPQQAGVIYDEADSSLKLFIAADALKFEASDSQKLSRFYTPSANTRLGFIHSQSLSAVDSSSDGPDSRSLSIQGNGALGISDNSFAALKWNANQADNGQEHTADQQVTDLYYRYDLDPRHYVQGGIMENQDLYGTLGGSQSFTFLPIPRISGVRAGTGRAYLNQSADFSATVVPVVLLNNARVDVYRGAQMLQTFSLNAGAHNLDVARFPDGSYPLTIKVYEGSRLVSEQTLPFAKHSGMNGSDEGAIDWFVQGGRMRSQDAARSLTSARAGSGEDAAVYQAGMRMPVYDWPLSLGLGLSGDERARYAEGTTTWDGKLLWGRMSAQLSAFGGSNGVRSRSENLSWSHDAGVNMSLYHTRTDTPSCALVSSPMYSASGCGDSVSASTSLSTGNYMWSASYTRADHAYDAGRNLTRAGFDPAQQFGWDSRELNPEKNGDKTNSYQFNVSRTFNFAGISLTSYAGVMSTQNRGSTPSKGAFLTLNATYLPTSDVASSGHNASTNAGYNFQGGEHARSQYNLSHNENWMNGSQRSLSVNASAADDHSQSVTLNGSYDGQYGNLNGALNQNGGNNNDSRSMSLNYDSSFSVSAAAGFSYGKAASNNASPQAAVILQVPKIGDEQFLQLQSSILGSYDVSVNRTLTVPVDGYTLTDFRLNEANESTVGNVSVNSGRSFEGFLLPGHVYLNQAQANVSYTYIGRLMRDDKVMSAAMLFGKSSAVTEDNGGFSLQMPSREVPALYAYLDGKVYVCGVQQHKNRADVVFVGSLKCQVAGNEPLPGEVQEQLKDWQAVAASNSDVTGHDPAPTAPQSSALSPSTAPEQAAS